MTQRELEELVLKVDEAFEAGSGPYDQWHARGVAFLANGHEGKGLRQAIMSAAEKIKARRSEEERSDREALYVSNGYLSDYGVPS